MAWNLSDANRYDEIREEVANLIEDFGIEVYPFSIWRLLRKMGIRVVPYSLLEGSLRDEVERVWPDAFTFRPDDFDPSRTIVFYNDSKSRGRIRFTLAHELGHLVLGHPNSDDPQLEAEANFFANYFLAPAPLVIRDSKKDVQTIMSDFVVSFGCARSVLDRTMNRIWYGPRVPLEYESRIMATSRLRGGGRVA